MLTETQSLLIVMYTMRCLQKPIENEVFRDSKLNFKQALPLLDRCKTNFYQLDIYTNISTAVRPINAVLN